MRLNENLNTTIDENLEHIKALHTHVKDENFFRKICEKLEAEKKLKMFQKTFKLHIF